MVAPTAAGANSDITLKSISAAYATTSVNKAMSAKTDKPQESADDQLTVFYDGSCTICSTEIELYRRLSAPNKLKFVNAADLNFHECSTGVCRDSALSLLQARGSNGDLYSGVDAFAEIWSRTPRLFGLSKLAQVGMIRQCLNAGYRCFIKFRGDAVNKANFRQLPRSVQEDLISLNRELRTDELRLYGMVLLGRKNAESFALKRKVIRIRRQRQALGVLIARKNALLTSCLAVLYELADYLRGATNSKRHDYSMVMAKRLKRSDDIISKLEQQWSNLGAVPYYIREVIAVLRTSFEIAQ